MKVILLMTALPPTVGHGFLLNWAERFAYSNYMAALHVIVGTQSFEPLGVERYTAIHDHVGAHVTVHHFQKDVQQAPNGPDDEDFWKTWCSHIIDVVGMVDWDDYIVGSEPYVHELAKRLDCRSATCDLKRETQKVNGTMVRNNPRKFYNYILPTFFPYIQKTVTVFGAESCGKTTLAKSLGEAPGRTFAPEWARQYLECLSSPETTVERMSDIVHGQYALQIAARSLNVLTVVQDTDLLSTIGYYRLWNKNYTSLPGYWTAVKLFLKTKSDLYVVCPSNIPFEKDPLRYGDGRRETTDDYWISLLKEFKCSYYIVSGDLKFIRRAEVESKIVTLENSHGLWGYKREQDKN